MDGLLSLKNAADQGTADAQFKYACAVDEGTYGFVNAEIAAANYKLASDQKHPAATMRYARCLRLGRGVPADPPAAIRLLKAAVALKSTDAYVEWALVLRHGRAGQARDDKEALRYFKLAAQAKDARGCLYYALCLEKGVGVDRDPKVAADYCRRASDAGIPLARHNYALMLLENRGVRSSDKNVADAAALFKLAADQGFAPSQVQYGTMLHTGTGVGADPVLASRYFKLAADAGNLDGVTNYGCCLEHGVGVAADAAASAVYYKRAAAGGHALAQNNHGLCFFFGRGEAQDYAQAFALFSKSAAQHCLAGMYNLGRCLAQGLGTAQNLSGALELFRYAADRGFIPAAFETGRFLENGITVEVGLRQAAHYYRRAADQGYPGAEEAWLRVMNLINGTKGQVFDRSGRTRKRSRDISKYLVKWDDFEFLQDIGEGRLGVVQLARMRSTEELLAVKTFVAKRAADPRVIAAFSEAIGELVTFTHPCILPIRGCSLPAPGVGARIATDYNPSRSLAEALAEVKAGRPPAFWDHQTVTHIIVATALGMKYLHANEVIHGALKPSNILLYEGGLVKVCDYGFIRFILDGLLTVAQERPGGPPSFKSPESNRAPIVWSDKMDVFSFGLILTEILTESDFFSRRAAMMVNANAATEFRPPWGAYDAKVGEGRIRGLCQRCWLMNPDARPSFAEILDEFDKVNYKFWPDVDPLEIREFIADLEEK